ncbi:MAG: phosphatidate cytidylyltransferase [Methylobacteriaceae bacterium]|nr:phosphatidate cytidylyltransferase [Methylobacteriaceae bacterium]
MPGPGLDRGRELRLRTLSGALLAALALLATWWGGMPFALLWLAGGVAVAAEWYAMARVEPRRLLLGLASTGLAVMAGCDLAGAGPWPILAIGAATCVLVALLGRARRDRVWGLGGFAYAAALALVPPAVRDRPELGAAAILWMFAVVWTTDIAAFFAGRRLGGPKLWPAVSPGKTWSGGLGGLLAATAVATGLAAYLAGPAGPPGGWFGVALASAVASVASQAGDLAESAMKRRFAVKDSGGLIPGHGGVMDRLDGFAAVAILCGIALVGARGVGL